MRTAALLTLSLFPVGAVAAPPDFDRDVVPVLAGRCLGCHAGDDAKGGLDLASRKAASGVVVAGKPDSSELWKKVAADEMPPKKPLSAQEKAILKDWIAAGAKWGADPIDPFAVTTATRAGATGGAFNRSPADGAGGPGTRSTRSSARSCRRAGPSRRRPTGAR
jgi:hypothetical protein